jgi:pimeloyl-ACP methyl ester carboxylesterase
MKLALLLPGYLESPDYRHLVVIDDSLTKLGYKVVRVDPCGLWQTRDTSYYLTTNYISQVAGIIKSYLEQKPEDIILVGHSLGCLVALQVSAEIPQVTKVVCLSPPSSLDKSDHKWVNGYRTSKKDIPGNGEQFIEFTIPYSFTEDRKQYSMIASFEGCQKPILTIMGEDDPSISELEPVLTKLNHLTFKKFANMGHDFRHSEEFCHQVADEIVNFVS